MFCFACASCSKITPLPEVHAWSLGAPLCSPECAGHHTPDPAPPLESALRLTKNLLEETGDVVKQAHPEAGRVLSTETNATSARNNALLGAVSLMGGAPGLAAGAFIALSQQAATASEDRMGEWLFHVDQRLHRIVAHLMLLEELGVPAAALAFPFVRNFPALPHTDRRVLGRTLHSLHEQLAATFFALG